MAVIRVKLKENSYDIMIGGGILPQLGKALTPLKIGKDAVIITDTSVGKLYAGRIVSSLNKAGYSAKVFAVAPGEKSKSFKTVFHLIEDIARYDVMKKIFIVALGGGVIGDLAGYIAACYKRGIPYVQVPTTFLAQIDSAIGGKTGVDLSVGKNLVGAFYQPRLVYSDVKVLSSLDARQIRNGLAEAVKYGVIGDKQLFEYIAKHYDGFLSLDLSAILKVVSRCSRIKADVVMQDEKETKGLRTILNFGHTLGHAIENVFQYDAYTHGEAVAIGMSAAAALAHSLGLLSTHDHDRIDKLLHTLGFTLRLKPCNVHDLIQAMSMDKKVKEGWVQFVFPTHIGHFIIKNDTPLSQIEWALQRQLSL